MATLAAPRRVRGPNTRSTQPSSGRTRMNGTAHGTVLAGSKPPGGAVAPPHRGRYPAADQQRADHQRRCQRERHGRRPQAAPPAASATSSDAPTASTAIASRPNSARPAEATDEPPPGPEVKAPPI